MHSAIQTTCTVDRPKKWVALEAGSGVQSSMCTCVLPEERRPEGEPWLAMGVEHGARSARPAMAAQSDKS